MSLLTTTWACLAATAVGLVGALVGKVIGNDDLIRWSVALCASMTVMIYALIIVAIREGFPEEGWSK